MLSGETVPYNQCCGSLSFWCRSGSGFPLWWGSEFGSTFIL